MPKPPIASSLFVSLGVGVVAAVGGFLFGYDIGVISGALLSIREEFGLSDFFSELITAGVLIGAVLGAAGGGWMADRFGRRLSNMVAGVIF
ncbi:MAG: MFS transporter, partial [Planctomycetota bacterium]|nr:MFS transporter [Planctomycetota bacterium]